MELSTVSIDRAQIIKALMTSPEFFIQFFLGDEIDLPVPDFHQVMFYKMVEGDIEQLAIAIPRGHAKTTVVKLVVVWYYLFSPHRFIVYLSNTATVAANAIEDVIAFMMKPNAIELFGEPDFIVDRSSQGYYKFNYFHWYLDQYGNIQRKAKVCMLRGQGLGGQVRGLNIDNQRPDLAIGDDMESETEVLTHDGYLKNKRWFFGTFKKALDVRRKKIIVVGNLVASICLLNDFLRSSYWNSMRYACLLSDGTPLWPGYWTLERILQDYEEYAEEGQVDTWYAEMMNMPIAIGSGLIRPDQIRFTYEVTPRSGAYKWAYITVDPAISNEDWAHKTGITVHGFNIEMQAWQSLELIHVKGVDPIKLFEMIVELATKWGAWRWGLEGVAYQRALKPMFEYMFRVNKMHPAEIFLLPGRNTKTERLSAWASLIRKGQYYLTRGQFDMSNQLLAYKPGSKNNDDDAIDSGAYHVVALELFGEEIMSDYELPPTGSTGSGGFIPTDNLVGI